MEAKVHINWKRGETRTFIWRREHWRITHYTWSKGKGESYKYGKILLNRRERRVAFEYLVRGAEKVERCVRHGELLWMMS